MAVGTHRIDGTREEILALLRHREAMGVEELAQALGLAGATVRRHLDVLLRDNYVRVTQVRGGTGRPRHLFSLTEAGADAFPSRYARVTQRLLGEIVGLARNETAGRSGKQIASVVFERMSARIAEEYAERVTGDTLEERAQSAASLIAEEGLAFEVTPSTDGRGVRLLGRGCLCNRVEADAGPLQPCEHDRFLLETLIGGRVVALDASQVPHDFQCGYLVTAV
ncbi:MAG: winged helix-turn-helix transcriptional regulator [Dehalococcoidia bacterium]|nr:winged helix-turn-helix transcriptional regulator [Dehalococcoidia bacterium]